MSDLQQAIFSLLKDNSTVTDLIGAGDNIRLSPLSLAQIDIRPAVVYQITGIETFDTFRGSASWQTVHFQFDIFTDTYSDAQKVSNAIRGVLKDFSGTVEDIKIGRAKYKEDNDLTEPPDIGNESPIVRVGSLYQILYRTIS